MVQNISASPINKIGMTQDGRVVYQIQQGNQSIPMSVPAKDADVFEKSFNDILTKAPEYEKYMQTTTPEQLKKNQKIAKWTIFGLTGIGALIPAIKVKGGNFKQILLTLAGGIAGFAAGTFIASSTLTPPGASKIAKASNQLSKIDIRPEQL